MTVSEIIGLIKVGLDKPKLYKRSVWNKAVKVMEFLLTYTQDIIRVNMGPGMEKYSTSTEINEDTLTRWALAYQKTIK